MKEIQRTDLDSGLQQALAQVEAALTRSHCPYSGLCVAAGLVLTDGTVVTGVNYESASYGLTLCAERSALARAQVEGHIRETSALLLSAKWQDPHRDPITLTPCGACRQWLAELAARIGKSFPLYGFWHQNPSGWMDYPENLLPNSFK